MQSIYLNVNQVSGRYNTSKATIWRWVSEKKFPQPVKLSAGCTRWKLSDLEKWESEKGVAK